MPMDVLGCPALFLKMAFNISGWTARFAVTKNTNQLDWEKSSSY